MPNEQISKENTWKVLIWLDFNQLVNPLTVELPFFFFLMFGGHKSFCGTTDTPVLDFWWPLLGSLFYVWQRHMCYMFPKFISSATPASLLATSIVAVPFSSMYLQTGIGGAWNWDLLYYHSQCETRKMLYVMNYARVTLFIQSWSVKCRIAPLSLALSRFPKLGSLWTLTQRVWTLAPWIVNGWIVTCISDGKVDSWLENSDGKMYCWSGNPVIMMITRFKSCNHNCHPLRSEKIASDVLQHPAVNHIILVTYFCMQKLLGTAMRDFFHCVGRYSNSCRCWLMSPWLLQDFRKLVYIEMY